MYYYFVILKFKYSACLSRLFYHNDMHSIAPLKTGLLGHSCKVMTLKPVNVGPCSTMNFMMNQYTLKINLKFQLKFFTAYSMDLLFLLQHWIGSLLLFPIQLFQVFPNFGLFPSYTCSTQIFTRSTRAHGLIISTFLTSGIRCWPSSNK